MHLLVYVLVGIILKSHGYHSEVTHYKDWMGKLKTIRNGIHKIDMYLNAALDLLGGEDGICKYKCSDAVSKSPVFSQVGHGNTESDLVKSRIINKGSKPTPRSNYKPPPPNGCGSPMFGVHLDVGIPSMTKCCNQHDRCYDTCGNAKQDCDEVFQYCLSTICRNVQKTLGMDSTVQACDNAVELLFNAVMHLGCKPYLDSQRATCKCAYEEKVDL